ncbi:hypothetical protein, partial [Brucella pseudogrignonensis]|uniref:hypothetical protein n=1 Tax=Brucella pseudogrignonensis TaxID=419475 RepID=UPI003B9DE334
MQKAKNGNFEHMLPQKAIREVGASRRRTIPECQSRTHQAHNREHRCCALSPLVIERAGKKRKRRVYFRIRDYF